RLQLGIREQRYQKWRNQRGRRHHGQRHADLGWAEAFVVLEENRQQRGNAADDAVREEVLKLECAHAPAHECVLNLPEFITCISCRARQVPSLSGDTKLTGQKAVSGETDLPKIARLRGLTCLVQARG